MIYSQEIENFRKIARKSSLEAERDILVKDLQAYCAKIIDRVSFIDSELRDIRDQEIREEVEAELKKKGS